MKPERSAFCTGAVVFILCAAGRSTVSLSVTVDGTVRAFSQSAVVLI